MLNGTFMEQNIEFAERASRKRMSFCMEDEDELIDLGNEREQVLAEMKQSLTGEQERALAFQIADRYISIHETEAVMTIPLWILIIG